MQPGMIITLGYFFDNLLISSRNFLGPWVIIDGNSFLYPKIVLKGGMPYERAIRSWSLMKSTSNPLDEAICTNSSMECVPSLKVDRRSISPGTPVYGSPSFELAIHGCIAKKNRSARARGVKTLFPLGVDSNIIEHTIFFHSIVGNRKPITSYVGVAPALQRPSAIPPIRH